MWLSRKWIGLGKPKFLLMGEAQVQGQFRHSSKCWNWITKFHPFLLFSSSRGAKGFTESADALKLLTMASPITSSFQTRSHIPILLFTTSLYLLYFMSNFAFLFCNSNHYYCFLIFWPISHCTKFTLYLWVTIFA